ncbi:hypothetical protein FACS189459_5220 [Bacilli bacterium]|nr:hypothetical protein FACS189459_5220 [Bacilli bacterium]
MYNINIMSNKLTKILKKIRIDNDEILFTMSRRLGFSSAYLSAIENNNREIPTDFYDKIISLYKLSEKDKKELSNAILESKKKIKIDISNLSMNKKSFINSLTRKFDDLDEETTDKLIELINKGGKK